MKRDAKKHDIFGIINEKSKIRDLMRCKVKDRIEDGMGVMAGWEGGIKWVAIKFAFLTMPPL